jgi:serine/threonine protein kinase
MESKNINPDDYVTLMLIGQGNFSELYLVEHKTTKILYTMKMFTKMRVEQLRRQEDVLMEKHVMNKVPEHDNIIKYHGSYKDEMFLYLLYEYVNGGELWGKSVINGLPSERLVKYYFLQILEGIAHMHKYNIVHRDIKVSDCLLSRKIL